MTKGGATFGPLYVISRETSGGERFHFVFLADRAPELLQIVGRFAANPELQFSWLDAALVSRQLRELLPLSGALYPEPD